MMKSLALLACAVVLAMPAGASAEPLLLRYPAISASQIVFTYAGDLWSTGRDGGEARRLTAGIGADSHAHFSPDGTMIAFTGTRGDNPDVYVIPASGGSPERLTFHPGADIVVGWTPDGTHVVFVSNRHAFYQGNGQLFLVPVAGGFATELPLPTASDGALSPDGTHAAYVPHGKWQAAWKRYRGGQTTPIWIADLKDSSIEKVPRENSNDFNPIWVGSTVYFLSDRNGPVSLFAYDTATRQVRE